MPQVLLFLERTFKVLALPQVEVSTEGTVKSQTVFMCLLNKENSEVRNRAIELFLIAPRV